MKPPKIGYWSIWKLLARVEDWEQCPNPHFEDKIRHKEFDVWFFANNHGIAFHSDDHGDVLECNPLNWWPMIFRTRKFHKAFPRHPKTLARRAP